MRFQEKLADSSARLGVIGLGYVGLPLAVYMARNVPVIGYDVNARRVAELAENVDRTHEVSAEEFSAVSLRPLCLCGAFLPAFLLRQALAGWRAGC